MAFARFFGLKLLLVTILLLTFFLLKFDFVSSSFLKFSSLLFDSFLFIIFLFLEFIELFGLFFLVKVLFWCLFKVIDCLRLIRNCFLLVIFRQIFYLFFRLIVTLFLKDLQTLLSILFLNIIKFISLFFYTMLFLVSSFLSLSHLLFSFHFLLLHDIDQLSTLLQLLLINSQST